MPRFLAVARGSQFGLRDEATTAALTALVPALAAGFQRNTQSAGGLESLLAALSGGSHTRYIDHPATLGEPETIADGNDILGHVFGSKTVSREVADRAAAQTGISQDILKQMLPMVAALMMGTLARQTSGSAPRPGAAPGLGGSTLISMLSATLDQNRDGSMIDDVMGMLGRAVRR